MMQDHSPNEGQDRSIPDKTPSDPHEKPKTSPSGGRFKFSPEKLSERAASPPKGRDERQEEVPPSTPVESPPTDSIASESLSREADPPKKSPLAGLDLWQVLIFGGVFFVTLLWSYWPSLVEMVHQWEHEPDYSHGYLVVPLALLLLWFRRHRLPDTSDRLCWWGLVPIFLAGGLRYFTAIYRMDSLDVWTIPLVVAGAVWLLFGRRVLTWALPGILFLFFMFPLPYSVERMLRIPLQQAATSISTWTLQLLGEPAIAHGNVILLGEHRLGVEEACSGIRIFVSIVALAYFFIVMLRRPWWQKTILALATLPIALVTNSLRIVLTGLAFQYLSPHWSHRAHDWIGQYLSPPVAALLFLALVLYLSLVFRRREVADSDELLLSKALRR